MHDGPDSYCSDLWQPVFCSFLSVLLLFFFYPRLSTLIFHCIHFAIITDSTVRSKQHTNLPEFRARVLRGSASKPFTGSQNIRRTHDGTGQAHNSTNVCTDSGLSSCITANLATFRTRIPNTGRGINDVVACLNL